MIDDRSTVDGSIEGFVLSRRGVAGEPLLALVLVWSREEPHRAGEMAFVDSEQVFGRGGARPEDGLPRTRLQRQRPGGTALTAPIDSVRISRAQLRLRPSGDRIVVESIGRCPLLVDGEPAERAEVGPGQTLQLKNELVFLVVRRPERIPARHGEARDFAFGTADAHGIVGESPAAWELRDTLAFAACAGGHVLVHGPSGSGKELAVGAIHELSSRRGRALVARNAATFPEGLVDAELFGNVKNYPNPGTAEREGLIGEADGTTLFLDEIGELPSALQAHLLRVLDRRGEYQRLGEARVRRADLRVVAATNRRIEELKHDFAARFTLRVDVPPLAARLEDVPLLLVHLLRRAAEAQADVARRFFAEGHAGDAPQPRIGADLVDRLVRYHFPHNLRDVEQILWQALSESPGGVLELTEGVRRRLARPDRPRSSSIPPAELSRGQVEATLARHEGNVTRAARELGLKNRFVLYRLMRRLGVAGGTDKAPEDEPD
jgi:two-component system nitrogen regulation response regulator GlnG/two-component system response regulator HydG